MELDVKRKFLQCFNFEIPGNCFVCWLLICRMADWLVSDLAFVWLVR